MRNVPPPPTRPSDERFLKLVGQDAWASLPEAVRRRFGRARPAGSTVVYAGEIVSCRRTRLGWLVAQAARLIGAPLPLSDDVGMPAVVSVMEDGQGGQFWTRSYMRRAAFPQVIHSRKAFAGPTGLEEWLGWGVGMALDVDATRDGLWFCSRDYFVAFGRFRWRIPSWARPGDLTVGHVNLPDGRFAFSLSLVHPLFGQILSQVGVFHEHIREGANNE